MKQIIHSHFDRAIPVVALVMLCVGCDLMGQEWTGFFYPNGNTFNETRGGPFKSKEECLDWAVAQVRNPADDYECGKNCKPSSTGQLLVCEETVDA